MAEVTEADHHGALVDPVWSSLVSGGAVVTLLVAYVCHRGLGCSCGCCGYVLCVDSEGDTIVPDSLRCGRPNAIVFYHPDHPSGTRELATADAARDNVARAYAAVAWPDLSTRYDIRAGREFWCMERVDV